MGSVTKPQSRVRAPEPDPYDGVELTDEDLEYVVGGLDPEYWAAQARALQEMWGINPRDR